MEVDGGLFASLKRDFCSILIGYHEAVDVIHGGLVEPAIRDIGFREHGMQPHVCIVIIFGLGDGDECVVIIVSGGSIGGEGVMAGHVQTGVYLGKISVVNRVRSIAATQDVFHPIKKSVGYSGYAIIAVAGNGIDVGKDIAIAFVVFDDGYGMSIGNEVMAAHGSSRAELTPGTGAHLHHHELAGHSAQYHKYAK